MRHLTVILLIASLAMVAYPAKAQQMSFSFEYRIQVNYHAPIAQQAGIRFVGARFQPAYGMPFGTMHFDVENRSNVCNIRLFAGGRPVADSGPLSYGRHTAWVNQIPRGMQVSFQIVANDCYGRTVAQDFMQFWTPPPEIVTEYQWEQMTVSRRTVRVGYR